MEEQLQAEPHQAARRRISARAPTDDDADGLMVVGAHELSSEHEDDCHRASEEPTQPQGEAKSSCSTHLLRAGIERRRSRCQPEVVLVVSRRGEGDSGWAECCWCTYVDCLPAR